MSERIANHVRGLGLENKAIVVGSGPLDAEIRQAHDVDLTVDAETYRALREGHVWQEIINEDGQRLLQNDDVEIGVNWAGKDVENLWDKGFDVQGVRFAGLHDVYAWKQDKNRPKDHDDLALIRERLYDKPLPPHMLEYELARIQELVPDDMRNEPALTLAANGLYIVRTIFGDHTDRLHTYSGSIETHDVPSGFHEYWHSAGGVERLNRHIMRVNQGRLAVGQSILFTRSDHLASLIAYSYHDSRMGDGRQSDNPTGFDELKAAETVERHMTLAGFTHDHMPEKSYVGIRATGYNEERKTQDIDPSRGYLHIQEGVTGTDLGSLPEPNFITTTMHLTIEDLCRVGAKLGCPLAIKAEQQGTRITSIEQGLAIVDSDPVLRKMFGDRLIGSSSFCKDHKFPESWTLDNKSIRAKNSRFVKHLGKRIKKTNKKYGALTATEAYAKAQEFVRKHSF